MFYRAHDPPRGSPGTDGQDLRPSRGKKPGGLIERLGAAARNRAWWRPGRSASARYRYFLSAVPRRLAGGVPTEKRPSMSRSTCNSYGSSSCAPAREAGSRDRSGSTQSTRPQRAQTSQKKCLGHEASGLRWPTFDQFGPALMRAKARVASAQCRRSGAAAFHLTWVTGARRSGNYAASFREMVVA